MLFYFINKKAACSFYLLQGNVKGPEGGVLILRGQGSRTEPPRVEWTQWVQHGVGVMRDLGLVASFAIHQLDDLGQVSSLLLHLPICKIGVSCGYLTYLM